MNDLPDFYEFSPDQRRTSIELDDLYDSWVVAARQTRKGRLRWKTVNGTDYLYRLRYGQDTGESLGRRSKDNEALYAAGQEWERREEETWRRLLVRGRMAKAARLPVLHDFAGRLLREIDRAGLLGEDVLVIGSMALLAYEMAAGVKLPPDLLATEDFDMAWIGHDHPPPARLTDAIKRADSSWTISQEKTFQARNRAGYSLDLVIAPELESDYPKNETLRALPIAGQSFLLGGVPVRHVVPDSLGKPACIVAPDPRLFALHKLWLSRQPDRVATKRKKDAQQAYDLLTLVDRHLPEYPLDSDFQNELPAPLAVLLDEWRTTTTPPSSKAVPPSTKKSKTRF